MFSKRYHPNLALARLALAALILLRPVFSQVVDCIVAEVNTQIITLTDIRILQAFAIGEGGVGDNSPASLRQILEGAVDQKAAIGLLRENVTVTDEEIDSQLKDVLARMTPEDKQRKLNEFGLEEKDLRPYLEEKLLFQKIIVSRFSQSINVSLKEIETYYTEVYLPSEKAQGREPKPMIQVLDELEAMIKNEKTADQIDSWILGLRDQAEVKINEGCLGQAR
jgi:hypothetical protein